MASQSLTLQLYIDGSWQNAAELTLSQPARGRHSETRLAYTQDHLMRHAAHFGSCDERALSERFPLDFEVWTRKGWPAFLLDVAPSGAARRWWTRQLGAGLKPGELELTLLRDHTTAPIGHLRIHAPSSERPQAVAFTKEEVCRRSTDFLEHAAEMGAAIGGATGAGGDAPKVLLVEDHQGYVYPEGALPDEQVAACWLVKWPRGRDTDRDRLILHTEYLYAHALERLGLDACPGQWHHPPGGRPSLWLPRFDRQTKASGLERLAVESFYSLAGIAQPGAQVAHQVFLAALKEALTRRGQLAALPGLAHAYMCRDLLDVVLGNADNHGRNKALLRGRTLRLAPIYDLAPMVMDPEGITRSSRWTTHERGGRIDWAGVCHWMDDWLGQEGARPALRDFAHSLLPLPDMLHDAGLGAEVLSFPNIHLRRLAQALKEWGLS